MSDIVVTKHDQGRIIEARQGDVIVFRLEENLTTGYGWEVETGEAVKGSVVELIESTYVEAPEMAMGRGGTRILRFVARSPGSQEIRLRLRRPWDPPDISIEHLEVTIRVR
jgi:predicted secreted protein